MRGGKLGDNFRLPRGGFGFIHGLAMSEMPPMPAPPPPIAPEEITIRSWNMWSHLSALSGLFVPFGNILGPLLVWQIKKHEVPTVVVHGKAALNFQLTVFLATLVAGIIAFILSFFCIGLLLIPVVGLIPLAGLVFTVIAGVKANDGVAYKYPFTLNLVT